MNRLLFLLLLLGCATDGWAADAKVNVADLLRPETALPAYREFELRTERERFESTGSTSLEIFQELYADFAVSELRGAKDGVHYLVQWEYGHSNAARNLWPDPKPAADLSVLTEQNRGYRLFASNGKPLSGEKMAEQSVVLDVDGDGVPEVIQSVPLSRFSSVEGEPPTDLTLLKVCRLDPDAKSSFALLFNANPENRLPGNVWGFQARRSAAGPAIELGPVRLPEGVEPKVVFRWDKAKRTWAGPSHKAGDHFLALKAGDERADAERAAERGRLRYPLVESPEPASAFADPLGPEPAPPRPATEPYRPQSLAALSGEQLWAYMADGRVEWYYQGRPRATTALPGLWEKDPPSAALAFVRRYRELATREQYTTGIPDPEEAAPGEGDLTVATAKFRRPIATLHHLHFAAEGSFLLRMERVNLTDGVPIPDWRNHWEVRRLDLSAEQARQLFQTVWWMSRVRALRFQDGPNSGVSDGDFRTAIVSFQTPQQAVTFGDHNAPDSAENGYSPSTFTNFAAQLFERHVPDWLGAPWAALAMPARSEDRDGQPVPQTAAELAKVKAAMAEVLRLFHEGKVSPPFAKQAVEAVGEQGWGDLRAAVEQAREVLPPLLPFERRRAEIDEQLKQWREKLGPDASEAASRRRESIRHPAVSLTDSEPDEPPPGTTPAPPAPPKLTPEEEQKFGAVDALYGERSSVGWDASIPDQDIAELRATISFALRQLDAFADPEALVRWSSAEPAAFAFAVQRLTQLDPKRAVGILQMAEQAQGDNNERKSYASDRRLLEERQELAAAGAGARLSESRRASLLEALRDAGRIDRERKHALRMLVPPEEPRRYADPEIDVVLQESLGRPPDHEPDGIAFALAQRAGGTAWKVLSRDGSLAARTVVAQHEPEAYRPQMRDAIVRLLAQRKLWRGTICWALWQLDLRELKSDLESLATHGPEDVEGPFRHDGDELEPEGQRIHLARQIASLWNEPDPLTRARLLVAFAIAEAKTFADEYNGALEHLDQQLAAVRAELTPAQLATVAEYITWCEAADAKREFNATPAGELAKVVGRLRAGLAMTGK